MAAVLTPVVRGAALRYGVLDKVGERKVHTTPIPRLGGIAIVGAFFAAVAIIMLVRPGLRSLFWANGSSGLAMLAGGLLISVVGLFDDLCDSPAKLKLLLQVVIACGLFAFGFRVSTLTVPWGVVQLGWLSMPVTVLWIVGVTNAVNLIDGLDGLAGGVSIIALGAVFFVAASHSDVLMMLLSASLAGALVGFLFYNFNPATIFMGDTGSLFLGFMLAVCSLKTGQKSSTAIALFPVALLALPVCDTLVAMLRRIAAGKPPFAGDREHFHHRLLKRGLSHRHAVTTLYAVATIFAAIAVVLYSAKGWAVVGAVSSLLLVLHMILSTLGYYRDLVPRRRAPALWVPPLASISIDIPRPLTVRRAIRRRITTAPLSESAPLIPMQRLRRDSSLGD